MLSKTTCISLSIFYTNSPPLGYCRRLYFLSSKNLIIACYMISFVSDNLKLVLDGNKLLYLLKQHMILYRSVILMWTHGAFIYCLICPTAGKPDSYYWSFILSSKFGRNGFIKHLFLQFIFPITKHSFTKYKRINHPETKCFQKQYCVSFSWGKKNTERKSLTPSFNLRYLMKCIVWIFPFPLAVQHMPVSISWLFLLLYHR